MNKLPQIGKMIAGCLLAWALLLFIAWHATVVSAADMHQATPEPSAVVQIARNVNIRSGPGTTYLILGVAYPGEQYPITGKNAAGTWWRIDYDGEPAWVFAGLVKAQNAGSVEVVAVKPATPTAQAAAPAKATGGGPPRAAGFDPAKVALRLQTVLSGLGQPTLVTNAGDGSNRLFVLERTGRIRVFSPDDIAQGTGGATFLDIQDRVGSDNPEQGLLGLAFAPNYKDSGYFYINYTDKKGDTVIARYRVSTGDWNQADRDSEVVALWVDQPAPNHNGGMLQFGPDGRLWAGLGDGGGANDTYGSGQNPDTPLGKILRLNVAGSSSGKDVPYDRWGMGLRNPWRFSFDPATGDLWIGDVGQDLFEEIDFVPAAQVRQGGLNFGWPVMEGAHCKGASGCDQGAFTLPELEYGHAGNGCSVTGGAVYRGQAYPQLQGVYLYADFCSGNVWAYWRGVDGTLRNQLVIPNAAAITSFGTDEQGELYVAEFGGTVRRVVVQ